MSDIDMNPVNCSKVLTETKEYIFMTWEFVKHMDNFTLTLSFRYRQRRR